MRLFLAGSYCYLRHGGNSDNENVGGDVNHYFIPGDDAYPEFLEGMREASNHFGMGVSYEIIRNLFFKFNVSKTVTTKDNLFLKNISLISSLGINY